jgi:zinc metalloprotease ZmpB
LREKTTNMKNILLLFLLAPLFLSAQKIGNYTNNPPITKEKDLYEKPNFQLNENYTLADVQNFLINHYPQLQQKGISLTLQTEKTSLAGRHFTFVQNYNDIPLYNVGGKVNINNNINKISSVLQNFQKIEIIDSLIFSKTEINEITSILQKKHDLSEMQTENTYFFSQKEKKWLAAYKIITFSPTEDPRSLEYIVKAGTKEFLQTTDRSAYFNHNTTTTGDTTGRGKIFFPDPVTKSHSTYGNPIKDNNNQNLPMFTPYTYEFPLKNIYYDPTAQLFRLQGPYAKIEDIAAYTLAPATSTNGDFFFTRNLSGFEDVMAYFHIDSLQRYIQSLGFQNIGNFPMRIDPHGYGNSDNSAFLANNINISQSYLIFGDGGVNDAQDSDVLTHEYAHAISFCASPQTNTGQERKGLDEGIGDYTAAFTSYDNDLYAWSLTYTWDGHNEYWSGRSASTAVLYPPTVSQHGNIIYDYGEIWASTLMQIRQSIGSTTADKLFFEELYHNYAYMTLSDAARLYLDADTALYNGVHTPIILQYFCARKLLNAQECANVSVETPVSTHYKVYPNPAEQGFTVDLGGTTEMVRIFNCMGEILFEKEISGEAYISNIGNEGVYFVRIGERDVVKVVVIR